MVQRVMAVCSRCRLVQEIGGACALCRGTLVGAGDLRALGVRGPGRRLELPGPASMPEVGAHIEESRATAIVIAVLTMIGLPILLVVGFVSGVVPVVAQSSTSFFSRSRRSSQRLEI
jgi:hypothetical protein